MAASSERGDAVLMTGGNCTHITGVFGGLQDVHGPAVRVGLVWFDAHGDFNTPAITLSGMLGGMPVAVCAGLAFPQWRELSHIVAPLPTDRIVMVDVRNLDPEEEKLIRAVGIPIVPVAPCGARHGPPRCRDAIWQNAVTCSTCTSTPTFWTSRTYRATPRASRTGRTWSRCWPRWTR